MRPTCRLWRAWTPARWPRSPARARTGSSPRNAGWRTWPPRGPRSGWAAPATGGETASRGSAPRCSSRGGAPRARPVRGRGRPGRAGEGAVRVGGPGGPRVPWWVAGAGAPAGVAQRVRGPMPRPPVPLAQRGTEFHRWLEQRFGPQRLIDPGDLLGAADADAESDGDQALAELRERFEAGEWADRWPFEVEVPFETLIGDRLVRGRIDAVFADAPDGRFDVLDWKTGRRPASPDQGPAVAVQLAAYPPAWAGLARVAVAAP